MFYYKGKKFYCDGVPVENIVRQTGTPVFIYSGKQLEENLNNYKKAYRQIPNIICFAVKANSNYSVCRSLFSLGAGADITSYGELYRALNAGAKPGKIVYAGVGKDDYEIEYALKSDVFMFNIESVPELDLINKISGKLRKRPKIAVRINPDIDPHTHRHITTGKKETKFGMSVREAMRVYLNAVNWNNVDLCGIHCHIGSQITETKPFLLMAEKLGGAVRYLKSKGINLKYVNIGGGLGIRYRNENPPTPQQVAAKILPVLKGLNVTLIMEPGRYIVGNTGILVTKIIYYKIGESKNYLIVDAGMNDLVRPTLYDAYHEILPVTGVKGRKERVDVVGPICEAGDFLGKGRLLPVSRENKYLAVKNAGAYGFSMSSQYNSRRRAAEVMVNSGSWKLIRRRETYKDLIVTEIINHR